MLVLGIDTATQITTVGVVRDGEVLAEASTKTVTNHTETLLPLVHATLAQLGLAVTDLNGIGVSIGPGSFTGLRIALGTVKGLAYAVGVKVVGVPTLEALAYTVSDWVGLVCPLLDARKQEVYAALFRRERNGELQKILPDQVVLPPLLLAQIHEPCLFLGDGVETYSEVIRRTCGSSAHLLPFAVYHPQGAVVARLAWTRLTRGEQDNIKTLAPVYVRLPEAVLRQARSQR